MHAKPARVNDMAWKPNTDSCKRMRRSAIAIEAKTMPTVKKNKLPAIFSGSMYDIQSIPHNSKKTCAGKNAIMGASKSKLMLFFLKSRALARKSGRGSICRWTEKDHLMSMTHIFY